MNGCLVVRENVVYAISMGKVTLNEPMQLEALTAEVRAYGEFLHLRQSGRHKGDFLSRIRARNQIHWDLPAPLFDQLLEDIKARSPISLIRLGDGEGNVLFWGLRRESFPLLANVSMKKIWMMMFGSSGDWVDYDRVFELMVSAVYSADYLGICGPDGDEHGIDLLLNCPLESLDVRGQSGAVAVWDWLSENAIAQFESAGPVFIYAWFHNQLTPTRLARLLQAADRLSVITCQPFLLDKLAKKFGVRAGTSYLIPPQHSVAKVMHETGHFPARFEQITSQLENRDITGELFLVGAGIIGKIYCDLIKKRGGMAIDVGSMMDAWMGVRARQYHDLNFMRAHSIFGIPRCGE